MPWQGAYRSTQLLAGPKRFVLGASGHVAGVINPASKNKRSYWAAPDGRRTRRSLPGDRAGLVRRRRGAPGQLVDRLVGLARRARPARWCRRRRRRAAPSYPVIEPAPGRYVKAKA